MNRAAQLSEQLQTAVASRDFTEAVLTLSDGSLLCFCHRVGQRYAKVLGPGGNENDPGIAGSFLSAISLFRLNAKHLDIEFDDGSRWDEQVPSRVEN